MTINNPLIRKISATLLSILLLTYVAYQIYAANNNPLVTETATYAKMSDTIELPVWVIRNETVLNTNYDGVISYQVADGEKVASGGVIAETFASEDDATVQTRVARIDTEIASLESLDKAKDYYSGSPDLIGSQISGAVGNLLQSSLNNDYVSAETQRSKLQYLLSEKRIILGDESAGDYAGRISELQQEKASIQAAASGSTGAITTPYAGFFISEVDGYENSFDIENIDDISVADINNVKTSANLAQNAGKIAKDFSWYVATVITEAQKIKIENSSKTYVEFTSAKGDAIPASVEKINKDPNSDQYALLLRCDYMSAALASIRNENAKITLNTYSGVLVNEKAIHFEKVTTTQTDENGNKSEKTYNNVKGVFIRSGGKIRFVQVFSDITINGYAICKTELSDDEKNLLVTDSTIGLYDEVITGGKNLYDGKVIR